MVRFFYVWPIALALLSGCGKNVKPATEPDSVSVARATFQNMKSLSREAIRMNTLCQDSYRQRSQGWAETCIKSNDQFMKLTLMLPDYANAGARLSSWGVTILQSPTPDLQGADELKRFMDDVEFFEDKANDARMLRTMPRCLNGVFSEYGSFIPNNCCDFYRENLEPSLADRFCSAKN